MKRSTPLKRTGFASKRNPMKQRSSKRKAYRASDEGQEALAYLKAVKGLPCCVSGKPPPNDAHHTQSGRYGSRKVSDFDAIPLAPEMHRHESRQIACDKMRTRPTRGDEAQ